MEIQLNKTLETVAIQGLTEGVFCGMSAGISVGHKGNRFRTVFTGGKTRFDARGEPIDKTTFFDLASLTKPLSTVLSTLHLVDKGKLAFEDSLDQFFPGKLRNISIENLLQHTSGLPAYSPYYQHFLPRQSKKNQAQLLDRIVEEQLAYATGSTSVYSDLGFILLGHVLEQCGGKSLEILFERLIARPLGIENELRFLPIGSHSQPAGAGVAATESCDWRGATLQGEVHDEHCWLMGGVAGHAGLFGSIEAVLLVCELLLDIWKGYASHPAFNRDLLCRALTQKHPHSGWCLGFDTPTPGASSSGRYFSPASVGHLGFSGTSFWIDPEKEVIIVLLTNRIHPTRDNNKIRAYRPYFHDQLMEKVCQI